MNDSVSRASCFQKNSKKRVFTTAMILAAGEGRRMRPLTLHTPKPLLCVNHIPLIEYHLMNLSRIGVEKVIINLAYLGEKIEAALGAGERFGLHIVYSYEPRPLETAGAIAHAQAHLADEPFLLINGDVWMPVGIVEAANIELANTQDGMVFLVANPEHNPAGDFSINQGLCFPSRSDQSNLTFSGLSILRPSLILNYPDKRPRFALKEVFDFAIANGALGGYHFEGEWVDVGTPERLARLDKDNTLALR